MPNKPLLMGAEAEYSMSHTQPGQRGRRDQFHQLLLNAVQARHRWLPDSRTSTGIYLDNGSRYYLDSGCHNEFSSPELSTPRQVAIYDRAAERILLRARDDIRSQSNGLDICITKNNVNFSLPDVAAWGQHEAYTCWIPLEQAAPQLIPHLVSRIPYAGAGCLSAHPLGMGFELSQRARHMKRETGLETTRDRAIFCTRAWKPSDVSTAGWTRTNLISKDSQRCSFGMYLTFGVTGLLFMILNEGHQLGRQVQLQDPVAAMRTLSLDPWLRARVLLANGKQATAIEIQRGYLEATRTHVESGRYPEWAGEVWKHWSATLDALERDPLQLANRLDTYLKLMIFDHQLERANLTWATLRHAFQILEQMRRHAPERVLRAVLNEDASGLTVEELSMHDRVAKMRELRLLGLDRLRFAVRLQAFELNYHELGGLFDSLAAAGQVDPVVVTSAEVDRALHDPPDGGRAHARSKCIAQFQGGPWLCDWSYVVNHQSRQWVDLRDPFTAQRKITSLMDEQNLVF